MHTPVVPSVPHSLWTSLNIEPWMIVGFAGNAIFMSRFLVQWIASERKRQSVIPVAFWWLSIVGSIVMSIYFLKQLDWPGIIGFLPNSVVYVRNLQLIRKHRLRMAPPAAAPLFPPPPATETRGPS